MEAALGQQLSPKSDPLCPYLRDAQGVSLIEVKQNSQERLR
jgi:hypothetical protein